MPAKKKRTKAVPKGYHRMPNGKLMRGATHKTKPTKRKSTTKRKRASY